MKQYYEKGKRQEDDNILNNLYQSDKNVLKEYPLMRTEQYKDYLIGKETVIRIPTKKETKRFFILSPQIVDSLEKSLVIIKVNQNDGSITFMLNNGEETTKLISATFDTITNTWDVRNQLEKYNKPSNLEESFNELSNTIVNNNDGIIYSETYKTMIDDVNRLYQKRQDYQK